MLIRIKAALTCGTDLKAFRRGHSVIPMPGPFGHEFSGIVADIGKGVKRFRKGDEIMAVHSAPCRICRYCKKKLYNLCENIMENKILGAFGEYILIPPDIVRQNVFHKPRNLSFEEAALLEPLSCVVHGIEPLHVANSDHALVIGSGPIGLLHLLLLKEKGSRVTVMDKHGSKLKVAKKLGADYVVLLHNIIRYLDKNVIPRLDRGIHERLDCPVKPDNDKMLNAVSLIEKIQNFTNRLGFDYVFECTGMPGVWESSVNYVRRGGTVILFGGCKSGTTVIYNAERLHYDEITLKGVFHYTPADVKKAYELLCSGRVNFASLISGRVPLRDTQKVFTMLSKGKGIKYAVIP
jgi:L-iditol 2-dehydrogenase